MRPASRPGRHTPDADLVAQLAAGDLSSLGLLFDRHAIHVHRFLDRLGASEGDADDLLQATFLLAADAAGGFRGGSTRAWLFGLAANLARRHRRSLGRMATRIAAWAREQYATPPPTPGDSLETRRAAMRAARALQRLSPKKREVFVMIVMEGVDANEVATALGIPVGTVWTRLHHARRELREQLEEESS